MGVGGLCPKRASAQIRCKCTKKNGAIDVSTSFFETRLCTLSLHALFSPHFPGITPFFFSKTRSRRALLPNLRHALRRRLIRLPTSSPLPGVGNTPTVKTLSPATRITRTSAVFDFCLHAFTCPSQTPYSQQIKCEGFHAKYLHPPSLLRPRTPARRIAPREPSRRQETKVKASRPKPSPLFT